MIKYLVMDVDGTLTDGKIYMGNSGEVCKAFNIKDGCGIHDILLPAGITPVIITGRKSDIVLNRCREIGITEVYQGVGNKIEKLIEIVEDLSTVAYIGDDINDLSCMLLVKEAGGLVGCPADAVDKVKAVADFIAEHDGGDGAVRNFIEWIVETQISICTVVSTENSDYDYYSHKIFWNVENIIRRSKQPNSSKTGYIVQRVHFIRKQQEHELEDKIYFEAWKVENGEIKYENAVGRKCAGAEKYDDEFSNGLKSIREYANPKGNVKWETKVYWIPIESQLWSIVDEWTVKTVYEAGNLKSAYDFHELNDLYFVADREEKSFSWG